MAAVGSSAFARRLAAVSMGLAAVTEVVESVAGLLRQMVHVAGWLVLLIGCVGLAFHPHLSLAYLMAPGGGVLAVLQGVIRPRRGQGQAVTVAPPGTVASRPGDQEADAEPYAGQVAAASDAAAVGEGILREARFDARRNSRNDQTH